MRLSRKAYPAPEKNRKIINIVMFTEPASNAPETRVRIADYGLVRSTPGADWRVTDHRYGPLSTISLSEETDAECCNCASDVVHRLDIVNIRCVVDLLYLATTYC